MRATKQHEYTMNKGLSEPGSLAHLTPSKILICQQRQIGDVVLSTPAAKLLKRAYPDAEIHYLTEEKCAPVLANNPNIHKVWTIDKSMGFLKRIRQLWAIRKTRFDLVVDFQQLPRCKSTAFFSGAPVRLSYTPKWYNRPAYTHWIKMLGGYAVKAKMSVLRPLGIEWDLERPEIFLTEQEQERAETYLLDRDIDADKKLITVDSTHWSDTRRWPAEYYAELIGLINERNPECRFLLLYGPGEKDQAQAVYDQTPAKHACILPEEQLGIRQTAALMEQAWLHLGNCSAPRHFALAVKTPTFTIVGSNSGRSWTFPAPDQEYIRLGVACSACNKNTCKNKTLACLTELKPPNISKLLPIEERV